MSRVDDDREAARAAARLAEQKRVDEAQRSKKATENATFSRLVGEQKTAAQAAQKRPVAKSAVEHLLETAECTDEEGLRSGDRIVHGENVERLARSARGYASLGDAAKGASRDEGSRTEGRHKDAQVSSSRGSENRRAGVRAGRDRVELLRVDSEASAQSRSTVGRVGSRDRALEAGAEDAEGRQGGNGEKDPKDSAALAASLRLNPALMAPVPVAQPKETSGSERLRKVANELAQRIVERVRVGTNAMGRAEFQVDLRQDVLSGLSVKVSAHHGKIRATFSSADKGVLKLIEQQVEVLKGALAGRGLTLEDVKIEARP